MFGKEDVINAVCKLGDLGIREVRHIGAKTAADDVDMVGIAEGHTLHPEHEGSAQDLEHPRHLYLLQVQRKKVADVEVERGALPAGKHIAQETGEVLAGGSEDHVGPLATIHPKDFQKIIDEGKYDPNLTPPPLDCIDAVDGQVAKSLLLLGFHLIGCVPIRGAGIDIDMAVMSNCLPGQHLGEGRVSKGTGTEIRLIEIAYEYDAFHG